MKIKILLCCVLVLAACSQEPDGQVDNATLTTESQVDNATPTPDSQMVWPMLVTVEPSSAVIGEKLMIVASGGYLQIETEAGIGYDESYRTFPLYLDSQEIGELGCFVNRCEGEIIILSELEPGEYELSVEGGFSLTIDVAKN